MQQIRTWDKVTEANGSHGDETEVETFKEAPVFFPEHEEASSGGQVQEEENHRSYSGERTAGCRVDARQDARCSRQMVPDAGKQRGHCCREDVAHWRYNTQRQGNPHQREQDAERSSPERGGNNVTITCKTREEGNEEKKIITCWI